MRVGSSSASPRVRSDANGAGSLHDRPASVDDPAHQGEAVGVDAGGGKAENDVARRHVRAGQERSALRRPDGEAGEVVIALRVKARHFGGFAADERAAGEPASFGDALDDHHAGFGRKFSGCEVVKEEQRLGALHDDVVDAHRHEVDPDGVVPAGLDRDLDLGADPVVGRDQDRVARSPPP